MNAITPIPSVSKIDERHGRRIGELSLAALPGYPLYSRPRGDDECGCCEGRGTVPPAGNGPYFDREEVLCVECDGTGEA